jgi:hypothetical protein
MDVAQGHRATPPGMAPEEARCRVHIKERISMKKILVIGASVAAMMAGMAIAEEAAPAAQAAPVKVEKKTPAAPVDLTVSGILEKVEHKKKDGTATWVYQIKGEDGSITRLQGKGKKGDSAVEWDSWVGAKVTVVGKGRELTNKQGVKMRMIRKIVSITKADAAPAN